MKRQLQWNKAEDTIDKIPAKKSQKLNPFGVKKLNKVKFEIENDDIDEVHDSTEAFRKGYTNPFTSAINKVIDEDDYDSDFEDDSKEESKKLGSKLKKKSSRNFMTEKDEFIHFDGKAAELEDEPSFKWKVKVPDYMQENIQKYRKEYEKFLVIHNNTSNKEVWKIYDHVTNDIYDELFTEVWQEFEEVEDFWIKAEFFS